MGSPFLYPELFRASNLSLFAAAILSSGSWRESIGLPAEKSHWMDILSVSVDFHLRGFGIRIALLVTTPRPSSVALLGVDPLLSPVLTIDCSGVTSLF